jgi:acylphosphatase
MRRHLYYSGRVQGVGFRFTAQRIASGFPVTGWVRNLPDGRVEMMVEGSSDEGEAFLTRLAEQMSDNIRSVEQYNECETGEFSSFEIVP